VVLLLSGHRSDLGFNLHKLSFIVWTGCFGVLPLALAVLSLITAWHGERRHHDGFSRASVAAASAARH
jgi:hypothetical protein